MIREKTISDNMMELIFPIPIYRTRRESNLDSSEKKDIEDIIKEGMHQGQANSYTTNSYIFNTKLKNLKEFCEQHIENYAKQLISPKEEINFYITQSWLTITKAGEFHHPHFHRNSIISGVFYISTVEDDKIDFNILNYKPTATNIKIEPKEITPYNTEHWFLSVNTFDLLLFPSWLQHGVPPNEKATVDRISLAFNTFAKGTIGSESDLNELVMN